MASALGIVLVNGASRSWYSARLLVGLNETVTLIPSDDSVFDATIRTISASGKRALHLGDKTN